MHFKLLSRDFYATRASKDKRKSGRKNVVADAWVRNGFAVRGCKIIDMSDTGVQIRLDTAQTLSGIFTFMTSRTLGSGRQARVKWRRGMQVGAEFLWSRCPLIRQPSPDRAHDQRHLLAQHRQWDELKFLFQSQRHDAMYRGEH